MATHIRLWSGTGSARITDMADAGKRGRTCRVLRFSGWLPDGGDDTCERSRRLVHAVFRFLRAAGGLGEDGHEGTSPAPFDLIARGVRSLLAEAALPGHAAAVYEEAVRGVDAPRPKLTAGVEGEWSASADEGGVILNDLADQTNRPTEITHGQTNARAYDLAAKAWDRVRAGRTFHEASEVLRSAGCRLHYFCAMD